MLPDCAPKVKQKFERPVRVRSTQWTRDSITTAQTPMVRRDSVLQEHQISEVEVGDVVLIKPGDKIPVDGVVLVSGALLNNVTLATGVVGHEGSALLVIANSMRFLKKLGTPRSPDA